MSATLQQIFALNPVTTILDTDLLYLVNSPYTPGTDAGITGADLKSLFVLNSSLPINVARGGTGSVSFTAFSVICAGTTSTGPFKNVSGVGSAGQILTSNGAGLLPTWQTSPSSGVVNPGLINQVAYYPASGSAVSGLATAANGVLITSAGSVPSISSTLPSAVQGNITSVGTITSGVWHGTAIDETHGGTNQTTYTLGDTLYASAANTLSKLAGNITTAKQYLSQTGSGAVSAAPVWATIAGGDITGAALTKVDDTNVTLTLGGTPTTALLRAASLTLGWTGQLGLTRGGTNASLTASNGGIVWSNSTQLQILAGTATAGLALLSGSSTTPSWSSSPPITQINTQTITATGAFTYTPTTGTKYAIFELQAGGGGSGGTSGTAGQSAASGAGASGGYLKILVTGSSNLAAITGSVGVGGAAGASGNNNGGNGGDTTLVINSGTTWTASHGNGGTGQAASASVQNAANSGIANANTTGTNATLILNLPGSTGGRGFTGGASITPSMWAEGAGSHLGVSQKAINIAGINYGGGASGNVNATGSNAAGAAGAQGVVIITEFISA